MKKFLFTLISLVICFAAHAQIKMHSNGQVSFQSTAQTGGVQIDTAGKTSFEPSFTTSGALVTSTKLLSKQLRVWNVKFIGTPAVNPQDRFYVTGNGDVYLNAQYTIQPDNGGHTKGGYPIDNASELLSSLKGYYYDNNDFEGFEPDYADNPNIAPEAVEGLMQDLAIDKSLGLSATELEEVLPEAIRHTFEGGVCINYTAIIPVLVEAFKEQQDRIKQLETVLRENGLLKP